MFRAPRLEELCQRVRNYLKSPLPLRGRVRVGVNWLPKESVDVQLTCFEIVSKQGKMSVFDRICPQKIFL